MNNFHVGIRRDGRRPNSWTAIRGHFVSVSLVAVTPTPGLIMYDQLYIEHKKSQSTSSKIIKFFKKLGKTSK